MKKIVIGYDAKRIVRNATGLGSYSRTLVNDLAKAGADSLDLRLYAPDEGRDELRQQVETRSNVHFCYPSSPLTTHHSQNHPPNGGDWRGASLHPTSSLLAPSRSERTHY